MSPESNLPQTSWLPFLIGGLLLSLAILGIYHTDWRAAEGLITDEHLSTMRPVEMPHGGFAGSDTCRECHQEKHQSWFHSWHRTMTQEAKLENIIGELNVTNLSFPDTSQEFSVFERDGQAWFGASSAPAHRVPSAPRRLEYPIVMMTGSHHQQVYWYPIGAQRTLGVVPVVYLKEARRWVPRKSVFLRPPSSRYDAETARWNGACLECHTTGPRPERDPNVTKGRVFETVVAEFGISCEACHGPGGNHVAIHRDPDSAAAQDLTDHVVDPAALDHRLSSQICGSCHSVSVPKKHRTKTPYHEPGKPLSAHYQLTAAPKESIESLMAENPDFAGKTREEIDPGYDSRFWWDGMPRIGGREYNGLLLSKCHTAGTMSCLSCHAMHQSAKDTREPKEWADDQLHPGFRGDRACLQCHEPKIYANPSHTHHVQDSAGSRCYNCHMPYTSFALLKSIRSHTISSPTVIETLDSGRPNACNLCHLDQTLEWTANHLYDWYQQNIPALAAEQKEIASAARMALQGDAGQRALIAWAMAWPPAVDASRGTNWVPAYLGHLLNDPYDAVRYIAGRSLKTYAPFKEFEFDFLSSRPDLAAAATNALEIWNLTSTKFPPVVPQASERVHELLSKRDDRRVSLLE